jgi:hypothetical protein
MDMVLIAMVITRGRFFVRISRSANNAFQRPDHVDLGLLIGLEARKKGKLHFARVCVALSVPQVTYAIMCPTSQHGVLLPFASAPIYHTAQLPAVVTSHDGEVSEQT